jgi:hypothetical protein
MNNKSIGKGKDYMVLSNILVYLSTNYYICLRGLQFVRV